MRILLTNDDGIHAEGMRVLMEWAKTIGEVSVYAPKVEQSAKAHAIEIHKPFEAKKVELHDGSTGWAVDSTPADCVRFAILGQGERFDLVISGVNRGLNIGADINYSGTVSAAFEAALLGVKAMAVSTEPKGFETARKHLPAVWKRIQAEQMIEKAAILNVNIPQEVTGELLITHQGGRYFSDEFQYIGNDLYRPSGYSVHENLDDFTLDTDATLSGHITITPLHVDRTDWAVYEQLRKRDVRPGSCGNGR